MEEELQREKRNQLEEEKRLENPELYLEQLRAKYKELSDKVELKKRLKTNGNSNNGNNTSSGVGRGERLNAAQKERMRLLTTAAFDRGKGEDTFGARDEDWQLYKLMSRDNDDEDEGPDEDETELTRVSSRLQEIDPTFIPKPETGSYQSSDAPCARPMTKEDFQIKLREQHLREKHLPERVLTTPSPAPRHPATAITTAGEPPQSPTTMADRLLSLSVSFLLLLFLSPTTATDDTEDTPITRFQAYLRFETTHPNPNYSGPVSFLLRQASYAGLAARTVEYVAGKPVVLLTWPGSRPDLPSILFNSHLDSVPVEPEKWAHPPFAAVRTPDGRIFARGAQDDKCVGLQYIEAIRNLREVHKFQPIRTVHVSYVPDEEIGGADGAAKFFSSEEFDELNVGFAIDEGQASPTDEFRVFYADRSPWHVVVRATGVPGHGSRMYDGSAMENLMESVEMMNRFRDAQFDVVKRGWAANSEVVSVNPVYLKAGIPTDNGFAMNMQPSEAEAGFDIRLPPTADPEHIMQRLVEEWAPASRNMTYQIIQKGPNRDFKGRPLMTSTEDTNPWWSVFKQAITAVGGKLAKPEILASTTDARFIRQRGIPALGFSPMSNTPILLHEHNEHLQDTVYLRGIKVYESIISSLSSYEGVDS